MECYLNDDCENLEDFLSGRFDPDDDEDEYEEDDEYKEEEPQYYNRQPQRSIYNNYPLFLHKSLCPKKCP